ncbi:MAG: hypothetical protein H6835_16830 [Planctomycetes bacterium]|nr:hypothetical protein [Planctomycetota bacterium]
MPRAIATVVLALAAAVGCAAQEDFAAFRETIEKRLKAHPFFSKVTMTLVEFPPFLFCVERPSVDDKDYEKGVAMSFLPFLRELLKQCDQHYLGPAGLQRRPEAGGYALAVLGSAGRYLDFRTAIGDPSLAMARAHYTPDLQLAVTYIDAFARHNTKREELHSLLHEFVHALQHAHANDGTMPKPVWFNEGLADYRSSCTHMSNSLAEPPLQDHHVMALAFGYANPAGRHYVSSLPELVSADSYKDVVDLAQKRNGVAVPTEPLLGMFYAQAEMFVRFLCEAEDGKYRQAFVEYTRAAQRGESGLATFQRAFGATADPELRALDTAWRAWLDRVLRERFPTIPDLTGTTPARGGVVPMSPPVAFDVTGLAWTAEDFAERVAGARRRCAEGDYEAGLALLPTVEEAPADRVEFVQRERERIAALIEVRNAALQALKGGKNQLSFEQGGERVRGKVVDYDERELVLAIGKDEVRMPLLVMTPVVLKVEAKRLGRLDGAGRWFEVWARWLDGESKRKLAGLLKLEYSTMIPLRDDLEDEFDPNRGAYASAVAELIGMPQVDDRAAAAKALDRLQELVTRLGKHPMLQRRKESVERLARAYAERAFQVSDPRAIGIHGEASVAADGSLTVEYTDPAKAPSADFRPFELEKDEVPFGGPKIAYSGPSGLLVNGEGWRLIGSAIRSWAVPLKGEHSLELDFVIDADFVPDFAVFVALGPERLMCVQPTGSVLVLDAQQQVLDHIGGGGQLVVGKTHRLRIQNDGKKVLKVALDGKQTALVSDVGRLVAGELCLTINSSTPVKISRIVVHGTPDPSDLQAYRDRFVAAILADLWPR